MAQDLRYGLRLLRKNPVFSSVAVLSLALGIGANTAIFSLIDAVMLKLLPVRDPRELLILAKQAEGGVDPAFYYETYERLKKEQPFFRELAAYSPVRLNVSIEGQSESSMGQLVSGNFYSVLGVGAVAGRTFTADDDRVPGGHPVAMISYRYWQRRFGLESSAVGRKVLIDGTPFTIVGVTPPAFFGLEAGTSPDVSVPVMMQRQVMPDAENWLQRSTNTVDWLRIFGRLKPGVAAAQASSGMAVIFGRVQSRLAAEIDSNWQSKWLKEWAADRLVLVPGATGLSSLRRQFSKPLFVLMGVVALVLLIACTNVANLLLARAAARRREIALRMAIGATRTRLVRQLLVESLLLSSLGGALGIVFAFWGSGLLVHFLSTGGPLIQLDLTPDLRILAFTAAISAATGILFGLAPAMRAAGIDLTPALKQGGRSAGGRHSLGRALGFGKALAAAQVTLSLVLVMGAGLLVRSLQRLDDVDPGFRRDRVFTVGLAPRGSDQKNGPNALRLHRLYLDLQERIQAIPGVIAASFAGMRPTMQLQPRTFSTADGRQFRGSWTQVYPKFFATLGAPILRGRDFGPSDMAEGAPFVAVINETLARRVFPNEDPIGKRIVCNRTSACEVIGVVRDIAYSTLKREPESTLYQTFLQGPTGRGQMELHVRFAGDPVAIAAQVRREVAATDPNLPAFVIRTLATEVDAALIRERLLALLSTVFGALAVLLAGIGLYGVIAYSVGRRTQEIGVRMALGASRREVWRLVLGETLWIAGAGIACGVPVSLAATHLIAGFLYGVKAGDPLVLMAAALFLAVIATIAGYVPARRASRIDPMTALRQE
ncbi:MAG TPA: ABC transporter permease [Bryobacteraceae bacterium]|nr:ABC transporter permease [Bryobacteraceae bacterium]